MDEWQTAWECRHGVSGGTPWECDGCVMAASLLEVVLSRPEGVPGPTLYFEEAVAAWGIATGNPAPRLAIDLWLARRADQDWVDYCGDRADDDARARYKEANLERVG